jgi:non-lysosomal glucosylceramidase
MQGTGEEWRTMTIEVERSAADERLGAHGRVYGGEALRHVAMPLGGLGSGQIALGGDGGLRQWQMVNQINHKGFIPDSFFAIRVSSVEPPIDLVRVLLSRERMDLAEDHTPLVNDDHIPADQRALADKFPSVQRTTFAGTYPFARVAYEDPELPVEVRLEAYSPFVPLDAQTSGLPAIVFTFRITNRWTHEVSGGLGATLQNAVGWDGITPISGNRCPLYGGNTNRVRQRRDYTSVVMENPSLPEDHPGAGQMVLAALMPDASAYERWSVPEQFVRFLENFVLEPHPTEANSRQERNRNNRPIYAVGHSPTGETWNGGLLAPYRLAPGESTNVTFVLGWHFPNRYVNFDQFGPRRNYGKSRFWVGNAYATHFANAVEVVEHIIRNRRQLEEKSRDWEKGIRESTLPEWMADAIAAQGSLVRSPTCFWAEDGKFYGFEGSLGSSTGMSLGTYGGSCPLNCTHVWNYEQALSTLFPELERTMRETDLEHVQAPEGYIPHRTVLPLYLPQFWDEPIGGPTNPALDGMLGTVLKVYREARQGAGREWLDRQWPRVRKLTDYITSRWDPDKDGVLDGEQPNTYDISFFGPNMYIGGLWLAALRAAEEIAKLQGEGHLSKELRELFERGSSRYDELLWNGEYYVQLLDPAVPHEDQFGDGCLADQLFGQWWAHLLELGHILPEEHVKTALRSIVRYNFRDSFRGFEHGFRIFADRDDSGLLLCTWPHGGRPEVPVRYCDEVWTGIEYQVGAHCIIEGLTEKGFMVVAALRDRYSGARRNPYNEIECGDHYARAMAGWSVLDAVSGFRYNALEDALSFAPVDAPREFRSPFVAGSGWGTVELGGKGQQARVVVSCLFGEVRMRTLSWKGIGTGKTTAGINGTEVLVRASRKGETSILTFGEPISLRDGDRLEVVVEWEGSG